MTYITDYNKTSVYSSCHKSTSKIFYLLVFIYMLMQMRAWIGFDLRSWYMGFILLVLLPLMQLMGLVHYVHQRRNLLFAMFILAFNMYNVGGIYSFNGFLDSLAPAAVVYFTLSIPDGDKEIFLQYIIKWLGWILSIGIAIYILVAILHIPLPNLGVVFADYGHGTAGVIDTRMQNYVCYLHVVDSIHSSYSFNRFNGPFIESGDLGCGAAFLLFAARYDFRRYKLLWTIALALLFSFSLAGFVLTAVGYLLIQLFNNKLKMRSVCILILLIIAVYSFGTLYNGGDNVLNETIFSRLQMDSEKGFSGNNRSSEMVTDVFLASTMDLKQFFFGVDRITLQYLTDSQFAGGVFGDGFISFFVRLGLLGAVFTILPYIMYAKMTLNRKYAFSFLVVFILFFFQRSQAFWLVYALSFVYGCVVADLDKIKNNKYEGSINKLDI